jgi:hypothetical protein
MPIRNALYTLSDTTPTQIVGADNMPHDVILHNMTKSSNEYIFIAGSSATAGTASIHMDPGQTLYMTLQPDDELWAVSDPDGLEVGVLDIRKAD